MADLAVYNAIEGSNMPSHQKSALRKWYEKVSGHGGHALARAKGHVSEGASALRQSGESIIVGGALGALSATLKGGLDVPIPKTKAVVPVDAAGGVVAIAMGVAMAHEPVACDLRNAGTAALTVFAFRKTHDLVAKKRGKSTISGEVETGGVDIGAEDPIVALASKL